jgi:hypothetical protein
MQQPAAIAIMAKQPLPGKTKTRLCPPLSIEQSVELSEALLRDTIALVDIIPGADLALAISPPQAQPYFAQLVPDGRLLMPVSGANIGRCLHKTLEALLAMGYSKALALNADGPTLPPEYLQQAIESLDRYELVFGPAIDGGYYLVGLTRPQPVLFKGIAWSTRQVLGQSLQRAKQAGLRTALIPEWYDVDNFEDLQRLQVELAELPASSLVHLRRWFEQHWTALHTRLD